MDDDTSVLNNRKRELISNYNALEFKLNELNTKIEEKKRINSRLANTIAQYKQMGSSTKTLEFQRNFNWQSMKDLKMQSEARKNMLLPIKNSIAMIDRQISGIGNAKIEQEKRDAQAVKKEMQSNENIVKKEKKDLKNSTKDKIKGHAGKLHGHMGSRNIGLFFILLFISTVIIDWYGRSGETFGEIATPFFSIPVIYLVQLIFIFWFYIDTDNIIDTVLLSFIFILNIYGAIPFIGIDLPYIFPLVILALFRFFLLKETPIQFNSIKVVVIILIVLAILFALLSAVSASIVSYAAAADIPSSSGSSTSDTSDSSSDTDGSTSSTDSSSGSSGGLLCTLFRISCDTSSESTSDDGYSDPDTSDSSSSSSTTSDSSSSSSTSSSSSPSAYSSLICFFYPPYCSTPVDTTDDGSDAPTPVSDGTVNEVKPALARPTMTKSETLDPGDYTSIDWVVKNIGDETIYTALFLINGSQIDGNQSGKIYLDSNYNSFSEKVDYPGVSISDEYFYHQYEPVPRSMTRTANVVIDAPQCSVGRFDAPVFVLYKYDVESSIMLTLADFYWWEELENQDQDLKMKPHKSMSTFGPFSLSIYPDDNFQPVLIRDGKKFGINFDLQNKDNGRASINSFDIYISNKLIPQDMGTSRCDLEANPLATPPSGMNAYTLKQTLLDEINSVDLSYDDGFKGSEEYDCSFIYDTNHFETDLGKGGSVQRYISIYVEYTYVYNGMFTLSTINDTDYGAC